jgi:hypothetical protein
LVRQHGFSFNRFSKVKSYGEFSKVKMIWNCTNNNAATYDLIFPCTFPIEFVQTKISADMNLLNGKPHVKIIADKVQKKCKPNKKRSLETSLNVEITRHDAEAKTNVTVIKVKNFP